MSTRRQALQSCTFIAVLMSCCACSTSGDEPATPVRAISEPSILMITVDTLRADHLGCEGYDPYAAPVSPSIDALARDGVRFSTCIATRGQTAPALCSLMTGRYPSAHGVRDNGMAFRAEQVTLSERLLSRGYETQAFISLLPAVADGHPARGVQRMEHGATSVSGAATKGHLQSDRAVTAKALRFLDGRGAADDKPFFAWVHLYGVHKPYECAPEHERLFAGDYAGPLLGVAGRRNAALSGAIAAATLAGERLAAPDHAYVLARYDAAVRTVDGLVAELLDKLRERGLAQDTLVVFSADHGEDLGDHNAYYYHGCSIYGSSLRVPWIMRWPGRLAQDRVVAALCQSVDFLPTLFELCGWQAPTDFEGVSFETFLTAADPPRSGPRSHAFAEWQDLILYVRAADSSYVFNPRGAHPRKSPFSGTDKAYSVDCEEFYDLQRDPHEQVNRIAQEAERALRMRSLAKEHLRRAGAERVWRGIDDAGTLARLGELGYSGSEAGRHDVHIGAQDCEKR